MTGHMTPHDWFVFFLCLTVFIALTVLFTVLICSILNLTVKLIRSGIEDEELIKERAQARMRKKHKALDRLVSVFLGVVLTLLMLFTLFVNLAGKAHFKNIPLLLAVRSDSMAEKNPRNAYLYENGLNDQVQMFDLLFVYRTPEEFDLELYDIVVYEVEGIQVLHRIIGIEEPNENHPQERRFILQGDAVDMPDKFEVTYKQMKGIYQGERIAFAGSFILFMQSPAGWLCMLLVVFAFVATPLVERKLEKEKLARLKLIRAGKKEIKQQ